MATSGNNCGGHHRSELQVPFETITSDTRSHSTWRKPRLNKRTLAVLGAMNLIDCINACLLTPYVDRMVSEMMGLSTSDPRVVQTVGLLIGLYSFCEVLFSPFWGYLADRFGRRPVLLIGLLGSIVAPIVLGLAQSVPVAFFARGLDGFFCGNVGVTKTYLGEIVDGTNETRGFSFLAVCYSLGLVVGPILGGQLVDAAQLAPALFTGTVFDRHPYLLPNLTYACFGMLAWLLGFCFLRETLPPWKRTGCSRFYGRSHQSDLLQAGAEAEALPPARPSTCQASGRWHTNLVPVKLIAAYCLLTGYAMAWSQNFALIVSLPQSMHGFGFGPREIGMVSNVNGIGLLSTQLLLYPWCTKRLGLLTCYVLGISVNALLTMAFPLCGMMTDPARFGMVRFVPLMVMMCFGQVGFGFCFPTTFLWLNRSLEGKDKGTWNGFASSFGALSRSIFPPVMDSILSFGLRSHLPGGRYLPIYGNVMIAFACMAIVAPTVRQLEHLRSARRVEIPPDSGVEAGDTRVEGGATTKADVAGTAIVTPAEAATGA